MSGSSRVIFSVYQEVNDHSVTSFKKQQLNLYKERLAKRQKQYADFCNADYFVFETDEFLVDDYTSIQFMKIKQFEELAKDYDEVLYLDLDVIPWKFENFFEKNDLTKICCLSLDCEKWGLKRYFPKDKDKYLHFHSLDSQNWWIKACAKNAMLLLDGHIKFNNYIINTGVIGGNKEVISQLNFTSNLNNMINLLYEAKEDNVYPKEIKKFIKPNNEVFFTYLIEKNNIPTNQLEKKWNWILDDVREVEQNDFKHKAFFLHCIDKKFDYYYQYSF